MSITSASLRTEFFDFIFSAFSGFLCISTQEPFEKDTFKDFFFEWPKQREEVEVFLDLNAQTKNVWFCINLLAEPRRKKEHCLPTNLVWSDLDEVNPSTLEVRPQVAIESSPGRYQGIWRIDQTVQPYLAEEYSRRMAYLVGADKSGWDLTQLLRVPFTKNMKYEDSPQVKLLSAFAPMLSIDVFEALPEPPLAQAREVEVEHPMPNIDALPDVQSVAYKYASFFRMSGLDQLIVREAQEDDDWSAILWRILNVSFEAGCSREEVFAIALSCNFNKYERDGRSMTYLWRDICKAEIRQKRIEVLLGSGEEFKMPQLVGEVEGRTIIDDYSEWASEATDAVPTYHPLCCFMILSSILAANVKLEAHYGVLHPHLWGLVLGNSTLTRKTTAMNLAMGFVTQLDHDTIVSSDGSMEGLLQGISLRNGQTSMFFKDEVTGWFESIKKKDYLAGMPEIMTQLYDVPPYYTRRLRKETISLIRPIFMFFGGGIRDKFYELIEDTQVLSGFLPRFLIVDGDADISTIRVSGPPTVKNIEKRQALSAKFGELWETYHRSERVEILGQKTDMTQMFEVILTDEAWDKIGEIEIRMIEAAENTNFQLLALPTFERMSRSLLKMACLLACARQAPQEGYVQCTLNDVEHAAKYIQEWGNHMIAVLQNCGKSVAQRTLDKILAKITAEPGISRGHIMRLYHLSARDMQDIQRTLEERGQIITSRSGNGQTFIAVGGA